MKGKLICGLATSLLLFGTLPSQASTLIDDGSYTVDTNTGLQWLDVSTTFNQSYNQVLSELSNPNSALYGYRYATTTDIAGLIQDAGVTTTLPCNPCGPAMETLTNILGPSISYGGGDASTVAVIGRTADLYAPGSHYIAAIYYATDYYAELTTSVIQLHNGQLNDGLSYNPTWGSFLVRSSPAATPLPAALPLFATGLGMMGLLGWRRKRRAQSA
jgi:hypothetical protein